MDLILWRHAEAEPGTADLPDEKRALTAKGHKQAWKMADWLDRNLPDNCRVLASPALRTVQTVEALGRKFKLHPDLATATTPERLLSAANWPDSRETVLIVGHQPTLGQVAAMLMGVGKQDLPLRKGSVWWFAQRTREGEDEVFLRAAIGPDMVGR